jgi:hypothetical protein
MLMLPNTTRLSLGRTILIRGLIQRFIYRRPSENDLTPSNSLTFAVEYNGIRRYN